MTIFVDFSNFLYIHCEILWFEKFFSLRSLYSTAHPTTRYFPLDNSMANVSIQCVFPKKSSLPPIKCPLSLGACGAWAYKNSMLQLAESIYWIFLR